jgi:3-hydroxyacyl-CoA dehydrogenase
MGSRIAAHLANAGIPSFLLDIAPSELTAEEAARGLTPDSPEVRNRVVRNGWKSALAGKPPALFSPELAALVTPGNFTDNLPWIQEVDWIIEAVTEEFEIKRALLVQVDRLRRPGCIVSSNTSGIPIHRLAEGFSEEFRRNFMGTHFFNPPRYMKLLELIPTPETSDALISFLTRFGEDRLGKGIVLCKDTPNFIANRIGIYGACAALRAMVEDGLSVEEVDFLTGPLIGRPRSATFRTLDVVGIDTLAHIARNLHESLKVDPERDVFQLPPFLEAMLQNRQLGEKTGQGFYKRSAAKDVPLLALDHQSMEYRPVARPQFSELDKAARIEDDSKRLRAIVARPGRAAQFVWKVLSSTICYAAANFPEIADDIVSVDSAMKWGFLHRLGPFETWDALGVKAAAARLEKEQRHVPALVQTLLDSGKKSFYKKRAGKTYAFAPQGGSYGRLVDQPGVIVLSSLKERKKTIVENAGASLIDIGDGVACLEFHTKMNTIDADVLCMVKDSIEAAGRSFVGLVIANDGANFSAGANLAQMLGAARNSQWNVIEKLIRDFQSANMMLRYSDIPVVAAPHKLALGGGCEIVVHADRIHASPELYIGFVETGVGLIPAAGGCKEMTLRAADAAVSASDMELLPRIRRVFELIAMARVSTSALDARNLGLLRESDHFSMNPDHRIEAAKQEVLAMARAGYRPPVPRGDIPVLGRPGFAELQLGLHMMQRAGYISEYDKVVGTQLAKVLTGGSFPGVEKVHEQHLLDLEREAFLSLCGRPETHQRIEHMLKTGKPLRN